MTSKERVIRALKGKKIDRIPIFIMSRAYSIRHGGSTFKDCLQDSTGETYSEVQYRCWRQYRYDGVMDLEGVNSESEALGCGLRVSENESPKVDSPVIEGYEDIDKVESKVTRFELSWPITRQLNVVQRLHEKLGKEVPIYANPQCPLRSAAMLRGIENTMIDMIDNPKLLHRLLKFTTWIAIYYGKALARVGADILMASNPIGSRSMISRRHYEEFSFPYDEEMVKSFHQDGILVILHICGDVKDRLDLIVQAGFDGVSLDSKVDLAWVKKEFGDKICLIGNVDIVDPLLFGTPEEVSIYSKKCLEILGTSGSMLGAGCEISPDTPSANLETLIQAAKTFAGN